MIFRFIRWLKQLSGILILTKQIFPQSFPFLLLTYSNPTIFTGAKQWALILLLFLLLGFAFFICIVLLNNFIIIAMIIVIMPYFYLLLHCKPIRDILRRVRVLAHCSITHFLCFKNYQGQRTAAMGLPQLFQHIFLES